MSLQPDTGRDEGGQRPEKRRQVAALCYRQKTKNTREVLLITSRDTGRWIVPKGWPISGLDDADAARQEAWEEAGVKSGRMSDAPIGEYSYVKRMSDGPNVICRTKVFSLEVEALADQFRERKERRRRWVAPEQAAEMVEEPELSALIAAI